MSKDLQRSIKSTYLKYILTIIATGSGFFLSILLTKYLNPDEFGLYSFVNKLSGLVAVFTGFGLSSVLIRYIPEFRVKKAFKAINKILKYALLVRFFSLILILSLIYIFLDSFLLFFKQPTSFADYILVIFAFIILTGLIPILSSVLSSYIEEYKNDYLNIYKTVITLFAFWSILYYGGEVYGIITSMLVIIIPIFIYLLFQVGKKVIKNLNINDKKSNVIFNETKQRVIKYAMYNFLTSSTGFLRDTAVDIFVISYYLNNEKVAYYVLGSSIALYLSKINPVEVLKNIFYPKIFKEYAESGDNIEILKKHSLFLTKLALFMVLPFIVLIIIYANEIIIYVYNPKYQESVIVLQTFSSFYFFRVFLRGYKIFFHSLEKNEIIFIGSLFGVVNFILSIIFIQYWGIGGVAMSTGLTWFFTLVLYSSLLKYKLKIDISFITKSTIKLFFNVFIFGIILITSKLFISNLFLLIVFSATALFLYLVTCYINKIFTVVEREFINSIIGKKIWVF